MNNEAHQEIEFPYPSNSHDSLLQSDTQDFHPPTITDDSTTRTNQYHSKDSALGLSNENLDHLPSNSLTHEEQIPSSSLLEDKSKSHFITQPKDIFEVDSFFVFNLSSKSKVKQTV